MSDETADTTSGEAIYSSDGLSPIPIPPPPPFNSRRTTNLHNNNNDNNDDDNDGIDYESKDAIEAFEVFSGRVFYPLNKSLTNGSTRSSRQSNHHHNETKLQKLARIQSELKELEHDFNLSLTTNNNEGDSNDDEKQQRQMEHNEIMTIVKDLTNKLQSLQNGLDVSKRQHELTTFVNSLSINDKINEVNDISTNTNNEQGSNVLTQEQRLLRIEQLLGSHGNIVGSSISDNMSILERLKQAEAKLRSVDETTLTQASNRAKVIRADLEAAAKARSKLNNTNVEDAAKITKLHNQLVDLDGFLSSNILSTIVHRLSTCATLHTQSMEFGSKLKALEDMVKDIEIMLGSVEESVKNVEVGLVENMKVIQQNMDKIDS